MGKYIQELYIQELESYIDEVLDLEQNPQDPENHKNWAFGAADYCFKVGLIERTEMETLLERYELV